MCKLEVGSNLIGSKGGLNTVKRVDDKPPYTLKDEEVTVKVATDLEKFVKANRNGVVVSYDID